MIPMHSVVVIEAHQSDDEATVIEEIRNVKHLMCELDVTHRQVKIIKGDTECIIVLEENDYHKK